MFSSSPDKLPTDHLLNPDLKWSPVFELGQHGLPNSSSIPFKKYLIEIGYKF